MRRILEHARNHRHIALEPLHRLLVRCLGWRWGHWLGHRVARGLEVRLNRWWVRAPAAASPTAPVATMRPAQVA